MKPSRCRERRIARPREGKDVEPWADADKTPIVGFAGDDACQMGAVLIFGEPLGNGAAVAAGGRQGRERIAVSVHRLDAFDVAVGRERRIEQHQVGAGFARRSLARQGALLYLLVCRVIRPIVPLQPVKQIEERGLAGVGAVRGNIVAK